jgi:hypothetical protein
MIESGVKSQQITQSDGSSPDQVQVNPSFHGKIRMTSKGCNLQGMFTYSIRRINPCRVVTIQYCSVSQISSTGKTEVIRNVKRMSECSPDMLDGSSVPVAL